MTIAEARSAYGIDAQPESKDNWTLLQLHPVKMGNVEVGVQLGARNDSGKIISVRLWSFFGAPNSAPNASPQDFDTLRTLLIQKYGHPAKEEVTRGDNNHLVKDGSLELSLYLDRDDIGAIGNIAQCRHHLYRIHRAPFLTCRGCATIQAWHRCGDRSRYSCCTTWPKRSALRNCAIWWALRRRGRSPASNIPRPSTCDSSVRRPLNTRSQSRSKPASASKCGSSTSIMAWRASS